MPAPYECSFRACLLILETWYGVVLLTSTWHVRAPPLTATSAITVRILSGQNSAPRLCSLICMRLVPINCTEVLEHPERVRVRVNIDRHAVLHLTHYSLMLGTLCTVNRQCILIITTCNIIGVSAIFMFVFEKVIYTSLQKNYKVCMWCKLLF